MLYYYLGCFILSLILSSVFFSLYRRHYVLVAVCTFLIIPVINLGYFFLARSTTVEEAFLATKITYLGGAFFPLFIGFFIIHLCNIRISRIVKLCVYIISILFYGMVLSIGYSDIYYLQDASIEIVNGVSILNKTYGKAHLIFYIYMFITFICSFAALIYGLLRKKRIPKSAVLLLMGLEFGFLGVYSIQHLLPESLNVSPFMYIIVQVILLIICNRVRLYQIDTLVADTMVTTGDIGFVALDRKLNYLGCNDMAEKYFPQLAGLHIDKKFPKNDEILTIMYQMALEEQDIGIKFCREVDFNERNYKLTVSVLYDDKRKRGYQIIINDVTREHDYVDLMKKYNSMLQSEVNKKTQSVNAMQERLIFGMADMVENRDTNTGGHIKRTSEAIKILVEVLRKDKSFNISESFADCLIKAAPMHDLGKIAVDDAVLRKPGKFSPEEFAIMKTHAEKGAVTVKNLLSAMDDNEFKEIAENVAHYHHERWDGSGYPKGLKAEQIPFEARIMAVIDVLDAVVSKRCYKDSVPFDDAFNIIEEGMGSQFDARLQPALEKCRFELKEYYDKQAE